jgi:hypothetical protein
MKFSSNFSQGLSTTGQKPRRSRERAIVWQSAHRLLEQELLAVCLTLVPRQASPGQPAISLAG